MGSPRVFGSAWLFSCVVLAGCMEPLAAAPRSEQQIRVDVDADFAQLNRVLPNPHVLERADQRAALGPVVAPALRKLASDLAELAVVNPKQGRDDLWLRTTALALLTTLGDRDAAASLKTMARSSDADVSQYGTRGQLVVRWLHAIDDAPAQARIIDDLKKIDAAHPESGVLTRATASLMSTAATPRLKRRLLEMALAMNNPEVAKVRQIQEREEREQRIASAVENRPLVLAGTTADGKPFSTAAWKGKVILVDFWATWCGPCVGELPRVKKMYDEYHARGLEVVGVSNDYSASALKRFVAARDVPWPELFDSAAAGRHQWNPLTEQLGITGIPRMLLIDRRGICRTASARTEMENLIPKLLAEPAEAVRRRAQDQR